MSYEAKGRDFVAKANKKLKGWAIFGNKYEEAAELLEKAANQFKLGKSCRPMARVRAVLDLVAAGPQRCSLCHGSLTRDVNREGGS
eukprot:scaffold413571_cov39-Prasinocladus_malaysianus.AAC.1